MKVSTETITPAMARKYLLTNTNNYRKVMQHVVNRYAKDMEDGLWEENGNAIVFSRSGVLLDGQHRLSAIVKANTPINMVVVRDVDDKASTFDYQAKRSDCQILKSAGIGGYARSLQASSVAVLVLTGSFNRSTSAYKETSIQHKREFLTKNEVEMDAVGQATFCGDKKTRCTVRAAVLCAAWCLFVSGEPISELKQFFSIVNSGFPVSGRECSPCIVLRNHLMTNRANLTWPINTERDFNATIRAYLDFKDGSCRRAAYQLSPISKKYFDNAHKLALKDVNQEETANAKNLFDRERM
jgi:hypothetical protein